MCQIFFYWNCLRPFTVQLEHSGLCHDISAVLISFCCRFFCFSNISAFKLEQKHFSICFSKWGFRDFQLFKFFCVQESKHFKNKDLLKNLRLKWNMWNVSNKKEITVSNLFSTLFDNPIKKSVFGYFIFMKL